MNPPGRAEGWLGVPPGAAWPSDEEETGAGTNPFLRYRKLLWPTTGPDRPEASAAAGTAPG